MLSHTLERFASIGRSATATRWPLLAALLVVAAITMPQTSYSQVLYGTLTGNVTDQQGAVSVGAKVEVKEVNTNVAKSGITDDRGVYRFSDLQPGTYNVTFGSQGFKTLVQKGVRVETNTVRRVDARLELSPVSEVLEVTFTAPALQTDRADVHITQTAKQVNELPIGGTLGRNYQSLMATVPGAVVVRTENGDGEANSTAANPAKSISFSTNGVSGWTNQTRMDGSPVPYPWLPTNTTYVPSAEAIEEVSIVTNSFNADQGLAGGTAVNVVVKSGTNKLHATAWGYDTNSHFTARQVFAPPTQGMPPKNIVAQFGANLGGPIIKDKLFFFANGERSTQRTAPGALNTSVAPLNLRPNGAGDVVFPTPAQDATYGAIIYDPLSNADPRLRTPFANNTIPASRLDQAARYLLARLPTPTSAGYTSNFVARGAAVYNRTAWDFKVNFAASSRLTMFARYGNSPSHINEQYSLGEAGGSPASGGQVGDANGRTQVFGTGLTYTFSPTLMLDANFGHTHQLFGAQPPDIDVNVGSDPDKMNIPGTNGPASLQAGGMPAFIFAPAPGSSTTYWTGLGNTNNGNPFQFRDNVYTASVNLQKTLKTHLVRLGIEYLDQQINHYQPQGGAFQTVRGSFLFDGLTTQLQGGTAPTNAQANSWASFLLGLPSGGTSGAGKVDQLTNPNSIYMKSYSAYLQDTWQVTRALTLSLGVRWDAVPFATRPDGKGVNRFDPADGYVYVGGYGSTPQDTGASGDSMFQPRAGLAYRLNDKTVFRAGYGRSMDPTSFLNFRNAYPTVNAWSMPQVVYNGVSNPYIPQTTLRQGLVNPGGAPDYSSGRLLLPAGTGTTTYPKDLKRGHLDSWNIALQRELASWLTTRLRGHAGAGADDLRQHQCRRPRPRPRRTGAAPQRPDERHH
jgi:Carboxypeptidase regulatory-like domain/TonB dependent receptor